MKTAMQELIDEMCSINWHLYSFNDKMKVVNVYLEKEKEQIIAAVRYGQNNHTENVYEEGELYYNEIYNNDTQIIKSSIPNGNIKYNQNK
jgi:hypothetical protein